MHKKEQIQNILDKAIEEEAIIIFTIVKPDLIDFLEQEAKNKGIFAIDALAPLMNAVSQKTNLEPSHVTGLARQKDYRYYNRMEAIEWTLEHDNGKNLETFKEADLIIMGPQNTAKTALSMHLACNLGLKAANFNIGIDTEVPPDLIRLVGLVPMVGLTIDQESLYNIRKERLKHLDVNHRLEELIAEELENAHQIYKKLHCVIVDVTMEDIEEISNDVMRKFKLPLKASYNFATLVRRRF